MRASRRKGQKKRETEVAKKIIRTQEQERGIKGNTQTEEKRTGRQEKSEKKRDRRQPRGEAENKRS